MCSVYLMQTGNPAHAHDNLICETITPDVRVSRLDNSIAMPCGEYRERRIVFCIGRPFQANWKGLLLFWQGNLQTSTLTTE